MHKHYGGIIFFENKSMRLLANCLENAVNKEQELPKMVLKCFEVLVTGDSSSFFNEEKNKKMRTSEDILKDFGMI